VARIFRLIQPAVTLTGVITCTPPVQDRVRKLVFALLPEDLVSIMSGTPQEITVSPSLLRAGGSVQITILFGRTKQEANEQMVLAGMVPADLIPQDPDVPAGLGGPLPPSGA